MQQLSLGNDRYYLCHSIWLVAALFALLIVYGIFNGNS